MSETKPTPETDDGKTGKAETQPGLKGPEQMPGEIGGPRGPEPTRFGDWENKGRCTDF
ncbi:MAG TPA: DUF1674 domain-containing protein [Azospirillum sp.]|nr:DUF1674 domain-containing protein [Azospirillum sp.]